MLTGFQPNQLGPRALDLSAALLSQTPIARGCLLVKLHVCQYLLWDRDEWLCSLEMTERQAPHQAAQMLAPQTSDK